MLKVRKKNLRKKIGSKIVLQEVLWLLVVVMVVVYIYERTSALVHVCGQKRDIKKYFLIWRGVLLPYHPSSLPSLKFLGFRDQTLLKTEPSSTTYKSG